MNKSILYLLTLALMAGCNFLSPRSETLLTQWEFGKVDSLLNADGEYIQPTEWTNVTIPHDWAISGPFDRKNDLQQVIVVQNGEKDATWKTGRSGGLPWMGCAWYRTTIQVSDTSQSHILVFDGAMSHACVFVNGEQVCYWPYGYNSFDITIDPFVHMGENLIEVALENKPESSRWYPGAGLYRNVHLITTGKTHIPTWGIRIQTPEIGSDKAIVVLDIDSIANDTKGIAIETDILFENKVVATIKGKHGKAEVNTPKLWTPETPNLYYARTRTRKGLRVCDEHTTRFGIRAIDYSPEYGFQLNGQTRKFQGVCLHHDLGPLGAAVHRDAIKHQLTILKEMGCDAIRTSHNMPAPELVELCEEMGLMMMLEPFDVWTWGKIKNDYHVEFPDYHKADITNMVMHYRNSPAVVMWSSGNEVWDQTLPGGPALVNELQELFHQLDPTRPVTNGMDQAKSIIYNGFGAAVEIPGLNYRTGRYVEAYNNLPQKMILGSETASTVSSRGVYKLPTKIQPDAIYADNQCSGYDLEYCAWSGLPEQDFALQDDYPWTLGQFVWTGFDYLGEPSPYDTDAWPSHSSYFGIVDLASLPKDRYYLYRSQWNKNQPTLHVLPHWNWQDGDTVPVFCYTSYPMAELLINGKSYGKLRKGESKMPEVAQFEIPDWGSAPQPELLPRYRLMWFDIPYEPGEVTVVAYNENGEACDTVSVHTASAPYALRAEWANQKENPAELCYVTISVVDKDGNLCPNANMLIQSSETGFVAAANGDAASLDPFRQNQMHAFSGQATFIYQRGTTATFQAEGIESSTITLK